eukprot:TRINITY_DN24292_c0_g1_i1.p1 TRINITY_DN24292_c0_g1~~TRINITY_DN24292_c0_g1_i1.p1  ORF type:complete len:105 (+),score=11.90 TRINITY_DN24292_c0_g1_i1:119-433(+)
MTFLKANRDLFISMHSFLITGSQSRSIRSDPAKSTNCTLLTIMSSYASLNDLTGSFGEMDSIVIVRMLCERLEMWLSLWAALKRLLTPKLKRSLMFFLESHLKV